MNERKSPHHFQTMKGRAVLILILLVGVFIAAALAIPVVLNMPIVRDAVLHDLEQRTGHRLTTDRLDFQLVPRPRLDLRQVEFFDRTSETPLLVADRLDITFQIWSLFKGRVVGEYVVVERPRMTMRRDETGRWTIGARASNVLPGETNMPLLPMTVVRNVLLTDGVVTIADETRSAQAEPMQLASIQATIAEEIPGRTARIQISGSIPQGVGSASFNVDGSLVLFHDAASTAEIPDLAQRVQVEGSVRINQLDVRHMAGWFGMRPMPTGPTTAAQLVAQVRLVPRAAAYDLIVDEWRAGLLDMSFQGTASLTDLGTATPRFSVSFSSLPMTLKHVLRQVPESWMPAWLRATVEEHGIDALIIIRESQAGGFLKDDMQLSVNGSLDILEGRFSPGRDSPTIREISAKVLYDLKQVRIVGLRANYGPARFSEGTVVITDWSKDPTADVRISGEGPAAGLLSLLTDRMRVPQLAQSLDRFEQVTGEVLMVAHVAGRPLEPGGMRLVNADVMIRNVGFRHPVLPVPIRQIQGTLKVSPSEIRVESLHGLAGPAQVEARGAVTLTGGQAVQVMTIEVSAEGEDFSHRSCIRSMERFPDQRLKVRFGSASGQQVMCPPPGSRGLSLWMARLWKFRTCSPKFVERRRDSNSTRNLLAISFWWSNGVSW